MGELQIQCVLSDGDAGYDNSGFYNRLWGHSLIPEPVVISGICQDISRLSAASVFCAAGEGEISGNVQLGLYCVYRIGWRYVHQAGCCSLNTQLFSVFRKGYYKQHQNQQAGVQQQEKVQGRASQGLYHT